jgi:Zn-dependent protease with chaperone function
VLQFRFSVNGVPQQAVSAEATPAAQEFTSPATATTGLALVNPYVSTIPVKVSAIDAGGHTIATTSLNLGPLAHRAGTIAQLLPSLPSGFRGSVQVNGSSSTAVNLVAWTLSSDFGVLSSYPPSNIRWPVSQYELIWKIFVKIINVAGQQAGLATVPTLVIDTSTGQINAFADVKNNQVHIFLNLAELISDSESELAFVIGHEVGHVIQGAKGNFFWKNSEYDADTWGMLLSLVAGYDPYGAAGALAKLSMASGNAGLVSQAFDNLLAVAGVDPHGSFNDRLALLFAEEQAMCSLPSAQSFCATYKSVIHPHLPGLAPLSAEPVRGIRDKAANGLLKNRE